MQKPAVISGLGEHDVNKVLLTIIYLDASRRYLHGGSGYKAGR